MLAQEIEIWYVIPAIRAHISKELKTLGLKQKDIAVKLDITEAAVSQYLKGKRASKIVFGDEFKEEIKESANKIHINESNFARESNRLSKIIKNSGDFCKIHKEHQLCVNCGIGMES